MERTRKIIQLSRVRNGIELGIFNASIKIGRRTGPESHQMQPSPIIFVSDFGYDHAPVECNLIMSAICSAQDVSQPEIFNAHHVTPFDIDHGSQVIGQLSKGARKGAVIVGVVDPGVGSDGDKQRKRIILETTNGIFAVGPDNGLFSELIARNGILRAWEINADALDDERRKVVAQTGLYFNSSTTFDGRDIFAPAAAFVACGSSIDRIGNAIDPSTIVRSEIPKGKVVDVDSYGDIKIAEPIPEGAIGGYVQANDGEEVWFPIGKTFADVAEGSLVGLRSSNERLELAVRERNASKELGIKIGTILNIRWITQNQR